MYLFRRAWWRHFVRRFFIGVSAHIGVGCALLLLNLVTTSPPTRFQYAILIGLVIYGVKVTPVFVGIVLFGRSVQLVEKVCAARGRVCPRCTYDLSNNAPSETLVCSECGYAAPIEEIVRGWKSLAYLPGSCEVPGVGRDAGASGGVG